jgi:ubiquitin-like protein Pup
MSEQIRKPIGQSNNDVGNITNSGIKLNTKNIDAVLDEIDAVLEKNAEEFVKGFIQKGGQ